MMATLETLFQEVDKLDRDELKRLYDYIEHKRQTQWWIVSSDNLSKIDEALSAVHQEAEGMDDDEINALIDEAIDEVRREQRED